MPITYIQTLVGIVRITEEDCFITSVHFLDDEVELVAPETPLMKSAVQQLEEYFAGSRAPIFRRKFGNVYSPLIMVKPSVMPSNPN
jgi:hypothetical protein